MGYFRSTYKMRRLDSETYAVIDCFVGASSFCYLCIGRERAALIDTGLGCGNLAKVVRRLTDKPVTVLCTHGHIDHCGGNYRFGSAHLSQLDFQIVKLQFDRRYTEPAMTAATPNIPKFLTEIPLRRMFSNTHNETYINVRDGQTFDLGGRVIEAVATPGHSVGSMCYLDRERGYVFSGDTVGEKEVLLNVCGSTDAETFLRSLLELKARSDQGDKVFTGHHRGVFPIDHSYTDRYIACAEKIVAGTGVLKPNRTGYSVLEGGVSINLPRSPETLAIPAPGELPYLGDYIRPFGSKTR